MKHPQLHIWDFLLQNINDNVYCMLLYVVHSNGSSPGRQGFCMAVNAQQKMIGSIGGGMMEFKMVELAKSYISNNKNTVELFKQIHSKEAAKHQSGMICSGEQTIVFIPISSNYKIVIENIINSLQFNIDNTLQITNNGVECLKNHNTFNCFFNIDGYNNFTYKEKLGYKNKLTIIGAGHCALALSQICSTMDFYIELFDDRENLNTFLQNTFVHHKQIINSYDDLKHIITATENHFVVIMTVGYRTDAIALKALQNKHFKYLGVLGSSNKMKELFTQFEKEGISKDWLQTIYTPIGLSIKSKTPQEIAISIAAQLIQVKNSQA